MNGPLPVSGQNFCSPALNLAAGSWGCWVSDELHHAAQQTGAWIGWNYQLQASRSTNQNSLKLERRCTQAVGHEQTSESRKPAMQQLESNKCPTVSSHGLRFPGRTNDGGAAHVSANWPQFVHASSLKERHGIHFIVLLSTPPLPSIVTSPYPSQHIALLPDKTNWHLSFFLSTPPLPLPLIFLLASLALPFRPLLSLWQHCEDQIGLLVARQAQTFVGACLLGCSGLLSRWNSKTSTQL